MPRRDPRSLATGFPRARIVGPGTSATTVPDPVMRRLDPAIGRFA